MCYQRRCLKKKMMMLTMSVVQLEIAPRPALAVSVQTPIQAYMSIEFYRDIDLPTCC